MLAAAGAVYLVLAVAMEAPQERLHLVEYGALATPVPRRKRRRAAPAVRTLMIVDLRVLACGDGHRLGRRSDAGGDNLLNWMYDLRDVGFNALAAAVALGAAAALGWLSSLRRAAARKPEK